MLQRHFAKIYLESAVRDEALTRHVLQRFPKATLIEIESYRELFNRPRQDFQLQKKSQQLVLARKQDHLLYPGNDKVQDLGYTNFHYNTLLLNCIYNCAYCYLQGMFQSANLVAFVNESDFFTATRRAIQQRADPRSPLYLAISYDTDLLAFETILPYCQHWIAFAANEPELIIEIRSKSAHFSALSQCAPQENVVLAWTLSPQVVIDRYEQGTPALHQRLNSVEAAVQAGWPVRLCFDPIVLVPDWQTVYQQFFAEVFERLPPEKIRGISAGVFRMNADYFSQLKHNRPDTDLIFQNFQRENNLVSLSKDARTAVMNHLTPLLEHYVPNNKLDLWTWQ